MKTELIFRLAKYINTCIYFLRFTIIFLYCFACRQNLNIKEILEFYSFDQIPLKSILGLLSTNKKNPYSALCKYKIKQSSNKVFVCCQYVSSACIFVKTCIMPYFIWSLVFKLRVKQ